MAKIEVDVPLFKRCCFCLPLRYGLFALGSLKLYILLTAFKVDLDDFTTSPFPWVIALVIAFNVLLMVASVMQKEKLFQIYYKCAIVEIVTIVIITVVVQIFYWEKTKPAPVSDDVSDGIGEATENLEPRSWFPIIIFNSFMLWNFCVQGYIILMVRSALIKIREDAATANNTAELESPSTVGKSVEV